MAETHFKKKRKKNRSALFLFAASIIIALLIFAILALLLFTNSSTGPDSANSPSAGTGFHIFDSEPRIPAGVVISDIDVAGLSAKQAHRKLSVVYPDISDEQSITFYFGSHALIMKPSEISAQWNLEAAINTALKGSSTNVQFSLDREAVSNQLSAFFKPLGGIYRPSGAWMEGSKPDLSTHSELTQTIVFDKGSAGLTVYPDDIIDGIISACNNKAYTYHIEEIGEVREPQPLDLQSIFSSICLPAAEPRLDHGTMTPIAGSPGYGFSIEEVSTLLAQNPIVRIPLQYLEPALSLEDVWFLDMLGGYKTEYSDNENRNNNLCLACEKLNGFILKPGESLSYNQLLGKRTTAAGYLPAPAYVGTELSDEVGGGICQVSSTLYLSALLAELSITDRRNHGYPVDYIPLGLDATVNWGTTDLKIRNDKKYAVKILAAAENGYVTIQIMGVEDRNYTVKYEYRVDDHPSYACAYRCRYDKDTGEEIYRKLDHTSIYLEDVWCWPGYASANIP